MPGKRQAREVGSWWNLGRDRSRRPSLARDLQRRRLFLAELRNHRIRARKLALHVDRRAAAVEGGAVQGAGACACSRSYSSSVCRPLLLLPKMTRPKASARWLRLLAGPLGPNPFGQRLHHLKRAQMLSCSRWQSSVRSSLSSRVTRRPSAGRRTRRRIPRRRGESTSKDGQLLHARWIARAEPM